MKKFFSKIWGKVLEFWYFTVRNTVQKRLVSGGFEIEFRQYDLRIKSISKNFAMKIRAGEYSFGYLVSSIAQGKEANAHGYAAFMYLLATEICKDDKLRAEVQRAIESYHKRVEVKKKVKEADGDEDAAIAMMKKDLERGGMTRQQRRKAEREFQKEARKIIKEDKSNE